MLLQRIKKFALPLKLCKTIIMCIKIFTDATKKNGKYGLAFVVQKPENPQNLYAFSQFFTPGTSVSINLAEINAIQRALLTIRRNPSSFTGKKIKIFTDSKNASRTINFHLKRYLPNDDNFDGGYQEARSTAINILEMERMYGLEIDVILPSMTRKYGFIPVADQLANLARTQRKVFNNHAVDIKNPSGEISRAKVNGSSVQIVPGF